jgi:hypothetical protein
MHQITFSETDVQAIAWDRCRATIEMSSFW